MNGGISHVFRRNFLILNVDSLLLFAAKVDLSSFDNYHVFASFKLKELTDDFSRSVC